MSKREQQEAEDQRIINYLSAIRTRGETARQDFEGEWNHTEEDVRQAHPAEWDEKEAWQTKCFYGIRSKTSETAKANISNIIFRSGSRFYGLIGRDDIMAEQDDYLLQLMDNLLDEGMFHVERDPTMAESVDQGTSFMKVTRSKDKRTPAFKWVSCYRCVPDFRARRNFYSSRFLCEEIPTTLDKLIDDLKKGSSIYSEESIQRLIELGQTTGKEGKDTVVHQVLSIDGTQIIDINDEYYNITLYEYWSLVPMKVDDIMSLEWRTVTTANDMLVMRNDENKLGIPYFIWRLKPRKYDTYGKGMLYGTSDLQTLVNQLLNLGFDSLKLSAMDIVVIDENAIADPDSIKYEPLAIWKMNDINKVRITRQAMSAIRDIMAGVTMIDQMNQDVTAVTRIVEGAQATPGTKQDETLGQSQMKMAGADKRFVEIVADFEQTALTPMIKFIFEKFIMDESMLDQETVNEFVGTKEAPGTEIDENGQTVETKKRIPKLDLEMVRAEGKNILRRFQVLGITQFTRKTELIQKVVASIQMIMTDQSGKIGAVIKLDKLLNLWGQLSDIPDFRTFVRTEEEVKAIREAVASQMGPAAPNIGPKALPQQPTPQGGQV